MLSAAWKLIVDATLSFVDDEALSRGAAIAFYAITSLAPVLLIVIAIAGLVFGRDAAQDAISGQFSTLMGKQAADVLQSVIASASTKSSSVVATIVGIVMLIATASGVFGGGGLGVFAYGFARRERRPDSFRDLSGPVAGGHTDLVRA